MINNISIFTNTLEKGGAETQAVELAKILSEKYNVYLTVFYGDQIRWLSSKYHSFLRK